MTEADEIEPSPTEHQIADIVDGYRQKLHDGVDPDPEACLGLHPELAPELADCLLGLAAIEELRNALNQERPLSQIAPRSLGDFQIEREIGRGGMGVVYEAIHTRVNRRVALKMIKAGTLANGQELEMFRKEALAAASLHHPNIVQLFELGEHESQPYLVLEFVGGGSLDAKLAGTPIDPYEAAQLLATLANAIHYAHERGIIHRDLKPANVLLALSGSGPSSKSSGSFSNPKITDFGLAKHLHADDSQTHSKTIKGTPSYMAPEQAQGGISSSATDVYALGAILYETLTGRPPFRAATPLETLMQVTSLEPVAPTRLQPKVPRDLETICLKCLRKEPSQRYRSAQELAEDLGRFLRHEPIHARPVGVGGRLWRWGRRNPVVAALLSLATALTVLVMVLLVLRLVDQRTTRERILSENVFAANHLANTVLFELLESAEAVNLAANDPEVLRLLKEDRGRLQPLPPVEDPSSPRFTLPENHRRLQPYLQKTHKKSGLAFHSWHVVDKDGILLADVPPPSKSVFGVSFQGRDYYVGAKRHVGTIGRARIHVSRAYRSANDDKYKIALSAFIHDGQEGTNPVGVVCATLTTDAKFGRVDLTDPERTIVLVGQVDTNNPHLVSPQKGAPSQYMILMHPAYKELPGYGMGEKTLVMPQEMLPLAPRRRPESKDDFVPVARSVRDAADARHDAFEDPLGSVFPAKYGGRWLAGFAQVGNTELVVIVQRRRDEWIDPWHLLLPGIGALLAAGLAAIALWRLRNRRVAPPKPATVDQAPTIAFSEPPVNRP